MRIIPSLLVSAFLSAYAAAQTTHTVTVQGATYSPASLTIEVGDIVKWISPPGFHNVDGSVGTYPSNPAGFGGSEADGYSHTFTVEGVYNYRCTPHYAMGMAGKITVNAPTAVEDQLPVDAVLSEPSPNPFRNETAFTLTTSTPEPVRVTVYDLQGREVAVLHNGRVPAGQPTPFVWSPSDAPAGIYFVLIQGTNLRAVRQVVLVR